MMLQFSGIAKGWWFTINQNPRQHTSVGPTMGLRWNSTFAMWGRCWFPTLAHPPVAPQYWVNIECQGIYLLAQCWHQYWTIMELLPGKTSGQYWRSYFCLFFYVMKLFHGEPLQRPVSVPPTVIAQTVDLGLCMENWPSLFVYKNTKGDGHSSFALQSTCAVSPSLSPCTLRKREQRTDPTNTPSYTIAPYG